MKIKLSIKIIPDEINMKHTYLSIYTDNCEHPNIFYKMFHDKSIAVIDKTDDKFSKRYGKLSNVIDYFDWIFK